MDLFLVGYLLRDGFLSDFDSEFLSVQRHRTVCQGMLMYLRRSDRKFYAMKAFHLACNIRSAWFCVLDEKPVWPMDW